jgi:hypothetical protein
LCTLAGLLGEDRNISVPALEPEQHLSLLQDVAAWFLETHGFSAYFTHDEAEALSRVEELAAKGQWPVLLTPLDTAGEKPYEEFVGAKETVHPTRFGALRRVPYLAPETEGSFARLLAYLEALKRTEGGMPLTIETIKEQISSVEADFARSHVASAKSLDQRV